MPSVQDDVRELTGRHTKAELRDMAHGEGMSIRRGATKADIARMLALTAACESCDRVRKSGHMEEWKGPSGARWALCPSCSERREDEDGWGRA